MALSNSERQERWRVKRDAEIDALRNAPDNPELVAARKEIDALRNAAKAPSTDSPELIAARKEIERLRSENVALRTYYEEKLANQAARKAKTAAADQTAAEKYADDDRAMLLEKLVQADKRLAAAKTTVRNLKETINHMQEWRAAKDGDRVMTFETFGLLSKCLRADVSAEEKSDAIKALNLWRSASRQAARELGVT
jgi:hypothetical protein